jgi:hypothetical protein
MGRKEKATSKAYQVRISTNALQNIDEITGYIAFINHQPLNAIKVGDAIFATIDRIALNPFAFKNAWKFLLIPKCIAQLPASPGPLYIKLHRVKLLFLGFYILPGGLRD